MVDSIKSLTNNYVVIGVISILLIGVCVYFMFPNFLSGGDQIEGYSPNNEHNMDQSANKTAEVLLFAVDWCPHCKTAKPVWEEIKQKFNGKIINGYNVMFTEYNCTEETDEIRQLTDKYNIEGYPTIKLLKDGNIINYESTPNVDTLTEFLNITLGN